MAFSMARPLPSSQRGLRNIENGGAVDMDKDLDGVTLYDPVTNPDGLIALSGATNNLMRDWLDEYCATNGGSVTARRCLSYGGVIGPEALSNAVAAFINRKFNPSTSISPQHVLTTNGVSSLLDMVAFNICDDGEGIMFPTPTYSMFGHDLASKAGLSLLPVSTLGIEDQFAASSAHILVKSFESVYKTASSQGINVKAVLICNPSNPIGRFYSKGTLTALARFCGRHKLHLVVDEIYGLSGFIPAPGEYSLSSFNSVLSLVDDPIHRVDTRNIHVLYGASKDFGMGGLRLGFLITRNDQVWKACRRVALFTWVSSFSANFFKTFLTEEAVVDQYFSIYQNRLREKYLAISKCLKDNGIPFDAANACLFVWLDLGNWLQYFDGPDRVEIVPTKTRTTTGSEEVTRETKLSRHLIRHGVFLSAGELSASPTPGRFRFVYTTEGDMALLAVSRIRGALNQLEEDAGIARRNSFRSSIESSITGNSQEKHVGIEDKTNLLSATMRRAFCF